MKIVHIPKISHIITAHSCYIFVPENNCLGVTIFSIKNATHCFILIHYAETEGSDTLHSV